MILNFGSINVDMVMNVDKLPTPGDTILCSEYQALPGGKGANQAKAAALAGSSVAMYAQVGEDEFGKISLKSLEESNVNTDGVLVNAQPTGCAMISVDSRGENIITVGSGANHSIRSKIIPDEALAEGITVMLQMEVTPKENWELLKRASKRKCRTILNLAPARKIPQEALGNLNYLIMNEVEARLLGKDLRVPTSNLVKFSEFLAKKFKLTAIVTRGEKGAFAFTESGEYWQVKAMKIQALDTTGAGDTFVGIFSAFLDQGKDIKTALHYAMVGSGLCCLKTGAQPSIPTLEEIEENLGTVPEPSLST